MFGSTHGGEGLCRLSCRRFGAGMVRLLFVALVLRQACPTAVAEPAPQAQAPVVTRVEPPSWWVGHALNPVRLMITGRNLQDAHFVVPAGFTTSAPAFSPGGSYAFINVHIPDRSQPGSYGFKLVTAGGEAEVPFTLLEPMANVGAARGFSSDDVIYLVMIDRFANGDTGNDDPVISRGLHDRDQTRYYHGGDIEGVIEHLDYLKDLGVTGLWLTPWYDNGNALNHHEKYTADNKLSAAGSATTDYHGYGAVDFYGVEEHFGTLRLLRELVRQARLRGIKVIQDQVANHTGPTHPWVRNPPTATWYNGTPSNHLANSWQTWTIAAPNPPADKLKSTLEGWFIDILPDLNQNDPEVAVYLIQNSLWWVEMTGVDAIRQDTLPYVPRTYWAQWTEAVRRAHPQLTVLGEMWDADPGLVSFFQGGRARFDGVDTGVPALFDFPLYYAIRDVFAHGGPMSRLGGVLAADTNYVDSTALVTFLGLHDTPRFLHESGGSRDRLQLAYAFLLTTRGTPLIYYGDEIGMDGAGDPYNRRDFPGGWAEDPASAFAMKGRTAQQSEVHAWVQKLLRLRRESTALRRGMQRELLSTHDTYAFARTTTNALAVVVLNNAEQAREVEVPLHGIEVGKVPGLRDRLSGLGWFKIVQGRLRVALPAKSVVVLLPEPKDLALAPSDESAE